MLYYNTVTPLLQNALEKPMLVEVLKSFRLVGGTSLSLQLAYRESVDIDLFTDMVYNTVGFKAIEEYLTLNFSYVSTSNIDLAGFEESFYIGDLESYYVKLDLYYTDLCQMLEFYFERYPYGASKDQILQNIIEFEYADNDADPNCLRGKYWDLIKFDFIELLEH